MLSLHKLDKALTQLDRMIAWADTAADDVNARDAKALGDGLPLSHIGLSECGLLLVDGPVVDGPFVDSPMVDSSPNVVVVVVVVFMC